MLYIHNHGHTGDVPILFLHGGGYAGDMWNDIINAMPGFNSIVVDLPGHGKSREVPLTTLAEAADAVVETLSTNWNGLGPINVVGLSFGSYVGINLIIRFPHLVSSALLSGFAVDQIPNGWWLRVMGTMISPIATQRWFRRLSEQSMNIPKGNAMDCWRDGPKTTPSTLRRILQEVTRFELSEEILESISTRILAVAGSQEHPAILQSLSTLQSSLANGMSGIAPDLGHAWPAEAPDLFVSCVRSWIIRQEFPMGLTKLET